LTSPEVGPRRRLKPIGDKFRRFFRIQKKKLGINNLISSSCVGERVAVCKYKIGQRRGALQGGKHEKERANLSVEKLSGPTPNGKNNCFKKKRDLN